MNQLYDNQERDRVLKARESFSGRLLTDSQFDEAIAITGIMEREIKKSGTFKLKLGDYAHAYARTEKFDHVKAETTIRELFTARCGQTMNQMREGMMAREAKLLGREGKSPEQQPVKPQLSDTEKQRASQAAKDVGQMIQEGNKMAFHRAYAHQAITLAQDFKITETGAKTLMKEQFKQVENRDLYTWGKEQEEKYYRPQIKAEQEAREAKRDKHNPAEMKQAPSRAR